MAARKFILHFDIRNTVLVTDSVTKVSVEESLNSYLTSVAWGTVHPVSGEWIWCRDEPCLERPYPTAISYYKYLESKIVKTPLDRIQFRKVTGNFTDTSVGERFRPIFDKYLNLLEFPHSHCNLLSVKGSRDDKLYHYLLPSFVNLLHYLISSNVEYKIILRTFGLDAPSVLSAVNLITQGCHPSFPSPMSCKVADKVDKLIRKRESIELHANELVIDDEFEIQRYLTSFDMQVTAVVDDFHYWLQNDYAHNCGKPFWLDPNDNHESQQIFFDDNIRFEDPESIVDMRIWTDKAEPKFASVNTCEFSQLKDMHLVQVDLLEAIENENYFVEKFLTCCRNLTSSHLI